MYNPRHRYSLRSSSKRLNKEASFPSQQAATPDKANDVHKGKENDGIDNDAKSLEDSSNSRSVSKVDTSNLERRISNIKLSSNGSLFHEGENSRNSSDTSVVKSPTESSIPGIASKTNHADSKDEDVNSFDADGRSTARDERSLSSHASSDVGSISSDDSCLLEFYKWPLGLEQEGWHTQENVYGALKFNPEDVLENQGTRGATLPTRTQMCEAFSEFKTLQICSRSLRRDDDAFDSLYALFDLSTDLSEIQAHEEITTTQSASLASQPRLAFYISASQRATFLTVFKGDLLRADILNIPDASPSEEEFVDNVLTSKDVLGSGGYKTVYDTKDGLVLLAFNLDCFSINELLMSQIVSALSVVSPNFSKLCSRPFHDKR